MSRRRIPIPTVLALLAALFAVEFAVLAIAPTSRSDWLLENALSVAAIAALALSYRRFVFSRISYTMIFVFLSLHEIGAQLIGDVDWTTHFWWAGFTNRYDLTQQFGNHEAGVLGVVSCGFDPTSERRVPGGANDPPSSDSRKDRHRCSCCPGKKMSPSSSTTTSS